MDEKTDVRGIVILRGILSLNEQLHFLDIAERKGGLKNDEGQWNFLGNRGRHFCGLNKYLDDDHKFLKECTNRFKEYAEAIDDSLIWKDVTHLLTLLYPDTKGIAWHVDDYGGNNGDIGAPVYSLTLGNSCIFEYKIVGGDGSKIKIQLNSGDLIVFGGPQREMSHSVTSVMKGTFKEKKDFDVRINMTFRTCTDFSDQDERFYQTDLYMKRLQDKWAAKAARNAKATM